MIEELFNVAAWQGWLGRGVLSSTLVAIPTALLGVFLHLRRRSLIADAHAHLALPGVVIAFLLTGSLSLPVLLVGATVIGLGASWMIEYLSHRRGIRPDAAIGIAFTPIFALGVILLSTSVKDAHIDTHCLLFGDVLGVPDRAIQTLAVVASAVPLAIAVFWRWLAVSTLDGDFAVTIGIPVRAIHYGLMFAVAATTMAAFEAVGTILVIAMIVVPAATAHLLADRLVAMLLIALGHGVASAWLGMLLSISLNCSTAGAMVVVGGGLYGGALLFAPRHGLLRQQQGRRPPRAQWLTKTA